MTIQPASGLKISFNSARFLKSAQKLSQCPEDTGIEIAFAGRSNAGKSTALNTLTQNSKLARTSKTPGRTQLINFFSLSTPNRRLVDLPGYGYAKVAVQMKEEWQRNLDEYLSMRQCLKGLVLVMDIRHPLTDFDMMMLDWSAQSELEVGILLTKADKLKKGPAQNTVLKVKKLLADHPTLKFVIAFSSLKKTGLDQAKQLLNQWLIQPESGIEDSSASEEDLSSE
jgi:GTP-binding protein